MPNYSFKCNKCNHNFCIYVSVKEYEMGSFRCELCDSIDTKRSFGFSGFNKKLSHEENVSEIKKEVEKIVKKVKQGSVKHIRDIYGN